MMQARRGLRRGIASFAALLLGAGVAPSARAADFHVDAATGSDANDGLSWATATATITAAAAAAAVTPEADVIMVAEGRYVEQVRVNAGSVFLEGGYARGGAERDWTRHRTEIHVAEEMRLDGLAGIDLQTDTPCGVEGFVFTGWEQIFRSLGPHVITDNVFEDIVATYPGNDPINVMTSFTAPTLCPVFERNTVLGADASWLIDDVGSRGRSVLSITVLDAPCTFRDLRVLDTDFQLDERRDSQALDIAVQANPFTRVATVNLVNVQARRVALKGIVDLTNVEAERLHADCSVVMSGSNITAEQFIEAPLLFWSDTVASGAMQLRDSIITDFRSFPRADPRTGCPGNPPVDISHSIVPDDWGEPNTWVEDPLFVAGPASRRYLSATAAGQPADSFAIDRGSRTATDAGLDGWTTRTDGAPDVGPVDLGYHSPSAALDPRLYVPAIRRGTEPWTLRPHAEAALPWTDTPGTASDPALPRLFYVIDRHGGRIGASRSLAEDSVSLSWR